MLVATLPLLCCSVSRSSELCHEHAYALTSVICWEFVEKGIAQNQTSNVMLYPGQVILHNCVHCSLPFRWKIINYNIDWSFSLIAKKWNKILIVSHYHKGTNAHIQVTVDNFLQSCLVNALINLFFIKNALTTTDQFPNPAIDVLQKNVGNWLIAAC